MSLHTGGVQHNTDASADSLGGEVAVEAATDDAVSTVGAADAAPVDTVPRAVLLSGSLGDEGDTLAEVEVGLALRVNTGNLDERDGVVLGAKATLVTKDGAIDVESDRFSGFNHCGNMYSMNSMT